MMALVVVGRLYHGWVLLSIGRHGASSDQVINLGMDVEGMGRAWCSSCPVSMGLPKRGCRGRGGLWSMALVHPGSLTYAMLL